MVSEPKSYLLVMKVVVGAAAAVALVLAAPAGAARQLTKAERAQINATVDVLVNNGVKRVNVARSYDVVTPTMRAGMTRKQWKTGDIPIYPFPAQGRTFHHWVVKYIAKDEIGIEMVLFPTLRNKEGYGPIAFDAILKPVKGRWLVDGFMPMATFAPVNAKKTKVRSVADFSPQPAQPGAAPPRGKINPNYLVFPFVAMGAILLAFVSWWFVKAQRGRRLMGRKHDSLPPLPPKFFAAAAGLSGRTGEAGTASSGRHRKRRL
jgi:hypothetical protein